MANASAVRERLVQRADAIMDEAGRLMTNELREAAPLGPTGDTRRGIDVLSGGTALRPGFTLRSASIHGNYVEEGTRATVIRPINGQFLRFLGGDRRISTAGPVQRIATKARTPQRKGQGGVTFVRVVHKKATPARPWFRPVVDRFDEFLRRASASVR